MTEIGFRVRLPGVLRAAPAMMLCFFFACSVAAHRQFSAAASEPRATYLDADTPGQLLVPSHSDFSLFRDEYTRLREANPDSAKVTRADAVASEAEIQTLLGETDQAFALWSEAFDLLSAPVPDTTLDNLAPRRLR